MTFDKLIKLISTYLPQSDIKTITSVYKFAEEKHKNEKRKSGEPYIIHPINTAYYLAEEKLDAPTIAAALLHDAAENSDDPQKTIKEIENRFGPEIATLVDSVTKLNKVRIKSKWKLPEYFFNKITGKESEIFEKHVDNLRKMLLAMTKDVRVILVKLADRLHNMKTIKHLPKEKQMEIAQETIEIYAPIAYRLGMGELKGTLEDLCFPILHPKEYKRVKKLTKQYYNKKEDYINKLKLIIKKELKKHNINSEIHGRQKYYYSLWKKLIRYNNNINKIYDLVALRIIVGNTAQCYKVLGLIHKKYKPLLGRIKDYIAVSKPNGYQSLHTTVFGPEGEIVEIQIRTWEMHEQAEFGVAAHWHYSSNKNKNPKKDKNKLNILSLQSEWLKELARWHEKITDPKEWTDGLKMDFFKNQIFVFTPQGDILNLPAESTPIDFAYGIHTAVGHSTRQAKVNGKLVKLNSVLNNGDIVEIIINKKDKKPKKDWLRFVKSHRAKDEIQHFYNKK